MNRLTPAVKMGLSIAAAVGVYGVSFGALAVAAGLDVWQACALSALMFTGGSQFAFIGVIAGGGTGAAAWAAATLLGVRNGVYGMQLKALIRPPARLIPLMAHLTIDESTATATAQDDHDERVRGFWTAGLGVFLLWNVFTLIGAVAGDALGDPKSWGLDGAAVAAFLGLLWPRLKGRDPVAIAVVAALVTAVAMPLVPPGIPVLIAAVVTAGWWAWRRRSPRPEPEGGSR
ncbi:MAG: AzlC family ABC transporter permease [Propionicimonas sp.]|uniref:AzlC family ABC transporter permease n=1 Tax=Propionicimonas sp. TaxID=1955623 RepID=UPI002B21B733|nr:AzlC family ABC transporter permease [Propionicimonas sp.]MEA4943459.1 AzlC family ABC transporter permease [Propionicimonas sp.]MEA5053267.1 AzlC family ABC transporter permease [Propionicimonas sp.]